MHRIRHVNHVFQGVVEWFDHLPENYSKILD